MDLDELSTKALLVRILRELEDNERRDKRIEDELAHVAHMVRKIERDLRPQPQFSTSISFKETSMLAVEAGNTLVYTGTLAPAGSILAPDAVPAVASNDPAVVPTLDSTGLIVTVPLPAGWVENATTPLAITYTTTSATTSQSLSATITPGAETVMATGISFAQTQ